MSSRNLRRKTWSIVEPACRSCVLATVITLLVAGCAVESLDKEVDVSDSEMSAWLADKPTNLHPLYRKVLTGGPRNRVLYQCEAALAAMDAGKFALAERSLDDALLRIETVYADNERARQARGLWHDEGRKDFKGEPYERAMAYFYRGLLYLRRGDFENARACFKSGGLQDAFAEEQQFRCDFATLMFLVGWASQCNGDRNMAAEAYKEVSRIRPDFRPPDPNHNVLIVACAGRAPRKLADGVGHYELKLFRGKEFSEKLARVRTAAVNRAMYPMEDVAWQAMTRGGRPVDSILSSQVSFARQLADTGTVLTDASTTAMVSAPMWGKNAGRVQGASAAIGLIGIVHTIAARNVKARADTRYWHNLPDSIHVATYRLPRTTATVEVCFLDASDHPVPGMSRKAPIHFAEDCGVCWVRSRSALTEGLRRRRRGR